MYSCFFHFQGMGVWELWIEEIKDAPPIPKVNLYFPYNVLVKRAFIFLFALPYMYFT